MKKIFLLVTCFIAGYLGVRAQALDSVYLFCYFKGNGDGMRYAYSMDGLKWKALFDDSIVLKSAAGKDKLMRDPCIIRGSAGAFHMVWTVSWNERGIGYAQSTDLVNWSDQRYLPVMEHEPGARNAWAPEVTFDPKSGRYFIYWASTIDGRFPQKDTAAESKYNHRMYYAATKDFRTLEPTQLLWDPGFSIIDATILPHEDGYVVFLKNETRAPEEKNIRVAFAPEITGPFSAPSAPIHGKYWAEGPTALKIGDQWMVYFDKYRDHQYGAVRSHDLKNWNDVSAQLDMPRGIRHGSVFTVSAKEFAVMQEAFSKKIK
jgi:hypothetical protein